MKFRFQNRRSAENILAETRVARLVKNTTGKNVTKLPQKTKGHSTYQNAQIYQNGNETCQIFPSQGL
jgi:hypothetical protein